MKKSKFKAAKFLTLLKSTEQPDGRHILDAPLIFYSAILNKYETVDEGFDTDFCSVPRFPLIYAVMGGRFNKTGALHDKLYRLALYPRSICDLLLREGIIAEGSVPVVGGFMDRLKARLYNDWVETIADAMWFGVSKLSPVWFWLLRQKHPYGSGKQ